MVHLDRRFAVAAVLLGLLIGISGGFKTERAWGQDDPPSEATVVRIASALDANGNNTLDDEEMLAAIRLWIAGDPAPGTDLSISDAIIRSLLIIWIQGKPIQSDQDAETLLDTSDCDFSDFDHSDDRAVRTGRLSEVFDQDPFEDSEAHEAFEDLGQDPCGLLFLTGALGELDFGFWVHSEVTLTEFDPGGFAWVTFKRAATWKAPTNVPPNRRRWANNIVQVLQNPNLSDDEKEKVLDRIAAKGDDYQDLVDRTGFMPGKEEHVIVFVPPNVRTLTLEFRFHLTAFSSSAELIHDVRVEYLPTLPPGADPDGVVELESEPNQSGAHVRFEFIDEPKDESNVLLDTSDCDFSMFEHSDERAIDEDRLGDVFDDPPFRGSDAEAAFEALDDDPCGLLFRTGRLDDLDFGFWVHSEVTLTEFAPGGFAWVTFKRAATWRAPRNVPQNRRRWANNIVQVLQNPDLSDEQKQLVLDRIAAKGDDYQDLVDQTGFMPAKQEHVILFLPPSIRTITLEFRFHLTAFSSSAELIRDVRVEHLPALPPGESPGDVVELREENGQSAAHVRFEFVDEPLDPTRPVLDFIPSATDVDAGEPVDFDGTYAFDPDGTIQNYFWDFGDGTQREGPQVSHVYEQPGDYEVTLTVQDNQGNQASGTASISVGGEPSTTPPAPPAILSLNGPEAIVGNNERHDVTASFSDVNGDVLQLRLQTLEGPNAGPPETFDLDLLGLSEGTFAFQIWCENVGDEPTPFPVTVQATLIDEFGLESAPATFGYTCLPAS